MLHFDQSPHATCHRPDHSCHRTYHLRYLCNRRQCTSSVAAESPSSGTKSERQYRHHESSSSAIGSPTSTNHFKRITVKYRTSSGIVQVPQSSHSVHSSSDCFTIITSTTRCPIRPLHCPSHTRTTRFRWFPTHFRAVHITRIADDSDRTALHSISPLSNTTVICITTPTLGTSLSSSSRQPFSRLGNLQPSLIPFMSFHALVLFVTFPVCHVLGCSTTV